MIDLTVLERLHTDYSNAVLSKSVDLIASCSDRLKDILESTSSIERKANAEVVKLFGSLKLIHRQAIDIVNTQRDAAKSDMEANAAVKRQAAAYMQTQLRSGE